MNNLDLINQYVNTGLEIPEHQLSQLPNKAKKTYLRKRLIATKNGESFDYYLKDHELSKLDKTSIDNYFNNRVKYVTHLEDFEVKYLDKDFAYKYAVARAEKGNHLNDEFFKILPDELKIKFINKRLDVEGTLTSNMLYFGGKEVINRYLKQQINDLKTQGSDRIVFMKMHGKNRSEYPYWYQRLDDKLKTMANTMMIDYLAKKNLPFEYFHVDYDIYSNVPIQFRKIYLKNLLKKEKIYLSSNEFNDLDESDKYIYVKKRIVQGENFFTKAEQAYMDKDTFLQMAISGNIYIDKDKFNELSNEQKIAYVNGKKKLNKWVYDYEEPYDI